MFIVENFHVSFFTLTLCSCFALMAFQEHESPFTNIVKKTLHATAHSCMIHINATEKDLEHLRDEPPYPEKAACILKCLLEKIGVVKNNKYSKIGFMTIITPLVLSHRKKFEHMKNVSENCDREISKQEESLCEVANEVTTCVFKYAPELHFKS